MNNINKNNSDNVGVKKCKPDLTRYFFPLNQDREKRFDFIYKLFGLNDDLVADKIGIHRTTMNRYRRGIFEPSSKMKLLIAQKISKLANYQIDSSMIFGEDLFFNIFKEKKLEGENES